MKSKLNFILAGLVALAAGYTFIFEYKKPQQEKVKKEQDSRLLNLKADQINQVEFDRSGKKTRLEKKETGWYLADPYQDEADNSLVQDLVDSLGREVYFDYVKDSPDAPLDPKTFGFDSPLATATFTDNTGQKNTFVLSGKKNFEGHSFLKREGDPRVFIVNTVWQSLLMRDDQDLRNRQLFRGKIAAIDEFEIKNKSGLLHLKLNDGVWSTETPKRFRVDQNKVREILSALSEGKYSRWIKAGERNSPGLEEYGLHRPGLEMKLKTPEAEWTVIFGQTKEKKTYAHLSETQAFVEIPLHVFEKFDGYNVDFVRDRKRAFDFDTTQVAKIVYSGELKKFEKIKSDAEFSSFLKIFKDYQALRFESKCKLRKKAHTFDFENESGSSWFKLELGETLGDGEQKVICAKSSMEEDLFVVAESFLKSLQEHSYFTGAPSEKDDQK